MKDSISISGKFYITLMEEDRVVLTTQSSNKVLRSGYIYLANGGTINSLSGIAIGSNGNPTAYTQTGLNAPLVQKYDEKILDGMPLLTEFQTGFMMYFPPGVGTGQWREIGALAPQSSGYSLFNRAVIGLINGEPMTKNDNQSAYASVIFTISRTSDA